MFSNNRDDIRKTYYSVWQKFKSKQTLTALEQQIAQVIVEHPEYHQMLDKPQQQYQEFFPEQGQTNPFLHMGLHLALREQVATNRPAGIAVIHSKLNQKMQSHLEAEHLMMDHLVEAMWQSQRNNTLPDETTYLANLTMLLKKV